MEAEVKVANSVLANAVWMLSDDSTEEIDNIETYGSDTDQYFATHAHLSHHLFNRSNPNNIIDYQPTSSATWYSNNNTYWA